MLLYAFTDSSDWSELTSLKSYMGTSLVVRWLRLCTSTAGGPGSIPGRGTEILHPACCAVQQNKTKQNKKNEFVTVTNSVLFKLNQIVK